MPGLEKFTLSKASLSLARKCTAARRGITLRGKVSQLPHVFVLFSLPLTVFLECVFWPLFISRRDGSVPQGRSAAAERESTRRSENREALLDASSRGSRGDPFEKLCVPLQDPAESLASRPSTIYFHLGPSASRERATASSEPLLPLEHCSPRCPKDRPTGRLAAQEMQIVCRFTSVEELQRSAKSRSW